MTLESRPQWTTNNHHRRLGTWEHFITTIMLRPSATCLCSESTHLPTSRTLNLTYTHNPLSSSTTTNISTFCTPASTTRTASATITSSTGITSCTTNITTTSTTNTTMTKTTITTTMTANTTTTAATLIRGSQDTIRCCPPTCHLWRWRQVPLPTPRSGVPGIRSALPTLETRPCWTANHVQRTTTATTTAATTTSITTATMTSSGSSSRTSITNITITTTTTTTSRWSQSPKRCCLCPCLLQQWHHRATLCP
mmetsp:Transcript_77273/g.136249  ORF Transcript_77273/g.136249 Transcript_77273/m.136249 type:complete len:253 (-) Transcript_77273:1016-1774(-)